MASEIYVHVWHTYLENYLPHLYKFCFAFTRLMGRFSGMRSIKYTLSKSNPVGCDEVAKVIEQLEMSVHNTDEPFYL